MFCEGSRFIYQLMKIKQSHDVFNFTTLGVKLIVVKVTY